MQSKNKNALQLDIILKESINLVIILAVYEQATEI